MVTDSKRLIYIDFEEKYKIWTFCRNNTFLCLILLFFITVELGFIVMKEN